MSTKGRRAILERDPATDTATRVLVEGTDELGREFHAEGECVSRFVNFCNENLVGWNHLVRWDIDGVEAWGEQHENYSPVAFRKYLRSRPVLSRGRLAACLTAADGSPPKNCFDVSRLLGQAPAARSPHAVAVRTPMNSMARCTVRLLICSRSVGDRRDPRGHRQTSRVEVGRRERAVGQADAHRLAPVDGVAGEHELHRRCACRPATGGTGSRAG